jgi:tetratricopeptide (TPR) repeat protein
LYTSLAGCLGAMGRYSEALPPLARSLELDPLNVEAYHNRAVVHERLGDLPAAIADYQTAVRYSPSYEPSRAALLRLTGTADVRSPANDTQQQAAELCQRASQAARRGAYAEAMKLLAEAERIAPEYVLVYQYQANVAYLMADYQQAEQALRKALKLEPDNTLFRRNLENILEKASTDQ